VDRRQGGSQKICKTFSCLKAHDANEVADILSARNVEFDDRGVMITWPDAKRSRLDFPLTTHDLEETYPL
jgi:hypothetical protein